MSKFYIDQHGCAKNQTDGELIAGFLTKAGYEFSQTPDDADFIIINTCGFIESAKKESINAVYNIKALYPKAKIILAGCLAQRYAQDLYENMPEVDGIFGNGDLSKIAEYMDSKTKREPLVFAQEGVCSGERPYLFNFKGSAYVKITEGCSNYCSFCAIPLIRGEVRSRPVDEIIDEIKTLVKNGVYEINLIGQDLAAFTPGLGELLEQISAIKGDFVVRTLYIHPDHFDTSILKTYKKDSRFLHYFDIPFQSGDDQIIHAMNRKGTAKQYVELVNKIRQELPDAAIRTTFLTGFPGETPDAALNTQEFLKAINPFWSGCFAYSREEGTAAWNMKNRVPKKLAEERADALSKIQTEITLAQLSAYVSKEINVLVEEIISAADSNDEQGEGLAIGRAWFNAPEVDGAVVIRFDSDDKEQCAAIAEGNVVKVKVLACTGIDLDARFVSLVRKTEASGIKYRREI